VLEGYVKLLAVFGLLVGALECFAGLKIMKVMMSVWGFLIGMSLSVAMGLIFQSYVVAIAIGIVVGTALVVVTYRMYPVGIFLIISTLVALAIYILSKNVFVSVPVGLLIGGATLFCINPLTVLSTAFSGAGIIIISAYALMEVDSASNNVATLILWPLITFAGILCQMMTISNRYEFKSLPIRRSNPQENLTPSELKYPGMQRTYRNYCIKCGAPLGGGRTRCRACGFELRKI